MKYTYEDHIPAPVQHLDQRHPLFQAMVAHVRTRTPETRHTTELSQPG